MTVEGMGEHRPQRAKSSLSLIARTEQPSTLPRKTAQLPVIATTLLIADPDIADTSRIKQALKQYGFTTRTTATFKHALFEIRLEPPACAIIEMRQDVSHGLDLIQELKSVCPSSNILVLTAYGNLTTAVAAAKLGINSYLTKPSSEQEIYNSLIGIEDQKPEPPNQILSANRIRWEHIQRIYELCERDISKAAARLNVSRRRLQIQLSKRTPL